MLSKTKAERNIQIKNDYTWMEVNAFPTSEMELFKS